MTSSKKNWLGFIAFIPAVALAFMDQSILPVALATIQKEFGATNTELQWCVNSYLLAIAVFVLISGKISDRLGPRNALFWGMVGFALSSAACALSHDIRILIIARGLQGLSAALMFPAQTALVPRIFPPEHRGTANGMIISIGSLFLILGPLIGGYLTESLSWRWIFWINLPITAIGLYLIRAFLPITEPVKVKIDFLGFVYFAVSITSLTLFFMQAPDWGWFSLPIGICVALTILFLLLLLRRERKAAHPFLELALFKRPVFAATNINVTIVQFILMIAVFRTIYLEEILGFTPLETGFITFVSSCPVFFMPAIAGFISDRWTPRIPIAVGYLSLLYSFFWFAFFNTPTPSSLMIALIAFGIGIPCILTPSFSSAMSSIPPQKTGVAFGMILTLRMLGGTMGLSLINLFVSLVEQSQLPTLGQQGAEMASFSAIHLALAFLILLAFAATFVLYQRKSKHQLPKTPAEGWD